MSSPMGLGSMLGSVGGGAVTPSSSPSTSLSPLGSTDPSSGSLPFQGQSEELPTQTPAARQLLSLSSQINILLQTMTEAYPAMSQFVDQAVEALASGIVETIAGMESHGSEVGQPQIV